MGKSETEQVGDAVKKKVKYRRPSQCRNDMRRALTDNFEAIVKGFVDEAKKGSCPHVKLATELLKPIQKQVSRKKGSVTRLLEKLDLEQLEKNRVERDKRAGLE